MTRVISADCHINEPPSVFDRVPAKLRDRAPKMMRGADGGDGWSFDGNTPKRTFGVEAMAGRTDTDQVSGLRFDEILPGNYDGTAHVADMDLDGIDVSIVYPGSAIFMYMEPDRELALACTRSYNDWILEDFQAADPQRIVGLPMIPVDDGLDVAVAELERAAAEGARAGFIPGFPARPYHDGYYDPLWAAAAGAGLPLTFHRTFGGRPPEADRDELVEQNVTVAGTAWRFFSAVKPFTYMAFSGMFERHPALKIVAAEVNMAWVPFVGPDRRPAVRQRLVPGDGRGDHPAPPERVPRREPLRHRPRRRHRLPHDRRGPRPGPGRRGDVLHRLPAQRVPVAELPRAHREADRGALRGRQGEDPQRQRRAVYGI